MTTMSSSHQINAQQLQLQQLLQEQEQYSSLSAQESFDLQDILQEPIDQEVIEDAIDFNQEDFDDLFEDQNQNQQSTNKVYQFKQTNQIQIGGQNIQKSVKNQAFQSESQKTKTILNRARRLSDQPLIPQEQIINMSYIKLKNVTKLFADDQSNTNVGIPTAITATGSKYLALGTSMGNIALFEVGAPGYKLLGTQQQRKFGYVNSIAISRDNKYLVAGHQTGLVALWDLYSLKIIKQQLLTRAKIIKVAFCSDTFENFITSDLEGNIYMFTIQKYIWSNLKYQKLIQKSQMVYFDIRYHQLQSQRHIIALCNLDSVFLISVKPEVKVMTKIDRPQQISQIFYPQIQMGHCQILNIQVNSDGIKPFYDVLMVAWEKTIYLYRFLPSNHSLQTLELIYTFNHQQIVQNIEYLNDNIFVTLDGHQIFRTIRFDITNSPATDSQALKDKKNLPLVSHLIINCKQMEEEVIYQRFLKDKENKYIKSFTNTLINCSFNPQQKEIFFICKNSVYRGRLNKWSQFVYDLINQQKNFKQALKICLELIKGQLNIFSQRIDINGKGGQKSLKIFCQIGKIFLQEELKVIKKLNHDRSPNFQHQDVSLIQKQLQQVYDIIIEYFIDLKCEKYLFSNIYQRIIKVLPNFQYWQLFLQALRSFINDGKLTCIPNAKVFQEILDYYSETKNKKRRFAHEQNDNLKLVDTMILNLTKESIFYQETVLLLTQNKLYKSLAYICSTNSDYISSCNKMLAEIRECHQSKRFNAEQQYYQILKNYLSKTLKGYYLNDFKIQTKKYQFALRDLTLWISHQGNMSYFINHSSHNKLEQESNNPQEKIYDLLNFIRSIYENLFDLGFSNQFHEFTEHLIQALSKLQPSKKQSAQKVYLMELIKWFKSQIGLNLLKFCIKFQNPQRKTKKIISLKTQQVQYVIQNLYKSQIQNKNKQNQLKRKNSIELTLQQKMTFLFFYFQKITNITYEKININTLNVSIKKNENYFYPFQEIYQKQCQHVKFLYNYLITNMLRAQDKHNRNHPIASEDYIQNNQPVQRIKSNKIQDQNQMNMPQQFKKKLKLLKIDYKKLEESYLKHNLQNLQDNVKLVDFILQNGTYDEIDDSIESLIKINSQLLIIYILQNYSIELVNAKLDLIGNQQIKYEVVRRILKIIRKQRQQKKQQDLNEKQQKRKVWGNEYKNYRKKKQAIDQQINSKKFLHYQKKLSKENLLFYLTELCKYKKQKRVYIQLKCNLDQYRPYFEDIIEIMKKFNLNSCLGLIYHETNELEKAFNFYQKIYNQRFQENIHKLTLVQYCHGRFLRKIYNQMLQICQLMNNGLQWLRLLQTVLQPLVQQNKFNRKRKELVIELIQKVFQAIKLDNRFMKQLSQVIETTLLQVSNNISMSQMSEIVEKFSLLLNKTFILNCLRSTLSTYSKNIYIYLLSNQMIVLDQVKEFETIFYDYKMRGVGYSLYCQRCREKIDIDDRIRVYKCSHVYHNQCISGEDRCQQCLMLEVGQNLRLNSVRTSSFFDNQGCLQLKKEQSSSSKSIKKQEQKIETEQEKKQSVIYQCLAFEDYLIREQEQLQKFKKEYEGYLTRYG